MAGPISPKDQFIASLGLSGLSQSARYQIGETLNNVDPRRLAQFSEIYKASIASGHPPADAAFSGLSGSSGLVGSSGGIQGDAKFAADINNAMKTVAHLATFEHHPAGHDLYVAAARTDAYVRQDTNYAAADARGAQQYAAAAANGAEVAARAAAAARAEAEATAQRQQDDIERARMAAGNRSSMRAAQAQAPAPPNHYGEGQSRVTIVADRDDQGRRNGKFMVMAPDANGGSHGIGGLSAAEVAAIRNRADQSPMQVADMIRHSDSTDNSKATLMAQLNSPHQDRQLLAMTMARLRAQQAGHDPARAVVAEALPPRVGQPHPGTPGAPQVAQPSNARPDPHQRNVVQRGSHSETRVGASDQRRTWHPTPNQA